MGLFSFLTQEIAIDLGTANTIIIHNGKVVVDEPSVVTIDMKTDKLVAIGEKARQMQGKTHANLKTIRPLQDGVIADFNAAEQMIRGMIKMINPKKRFFSPALKMVICIPSGSTEVEIRAVRYSSEHAGGRDVYMIYEPMAAAIGTVRLAQRRRRPARARPGRPRAAPGRRPHARDERRDPRLPRERPVPGACGAAGGDRDGAHSGRLRARPVPAA